MWVFFFFKKRGLRCWYFTGVTRGNELMKGICKVFAFCSYFLSWITNLQKPGSGHTHSSESEGPDFILSS